MQTSTYLKIIIPIVLLGLSGLGAWFLIGQKSKAVTVTAERKPPEVSVINANRAALAMNVLSQGVIRPRTEINLVSQIPGKVLKVHPALLNDGFFKQGDVLLSLDTRDYGFAVTQAEAGVAEARKDLLQEQEEGKQAHKEWETLGSGQASEFVLRKPHLADRRAKLAAALAELEQAKLNYSRGELRAPFDGRVRNRQVDIGQFVSAGETLATLYASDSVEVRLPVAKDQTRFLQLPLSYPDGKPQAAGPVVTLSADLAGKRQHWQGRIVRTEGTVDEKSGLFYVVAQIPKPFNYRQNQLPLALGLFVGAEIAGVERHDVFKIPQNALHSGYQVYVLDDEDRLRLRTVEVIRNDQDTVIVSGGLQEGERIMVAGIDLPIVGMKVTVKNAPQTVGLAP